MLLLLLAGCLAVGALDEPAANSLAPSAPAPRTSAPDAPAPDGSGPRLVVLSQAGDDRHLRLLEPGRTGAAQRRPLGFLSPDGASLYTVEAGRNKTTVAAYDMETGHELRRTALDGQYFVPAEVALQAPLAFSGDGRRLLLRRAATESELKSWETNGRPRSEFAVLDTDFARPPILLDLAGEFWFDTLSRDGKWLYLTEIQDPYPVSYSPEKAPHYQVRAYDVDSGRLLPDPIVDKRDLEQMSGYRGAGIFSADGNWLYSLYTRPDEAPFIHTLNLANQTALCIDLPFTDTADHEADLLWALALSGNGRMLYAINGMTGQVVQVDTVEGYTVAQSATLPLDTTTTAQGSTRSLLARIGRWLAPVARAKIVRVPAAVVSPDGATLFATGRTGLLAVTTADLRLRDRYLPDLELNSLALDAGEGRLYTVAGTPPDPASLLVVDPHTGEVLREIEGVGQPRAVLRVGQP